MPTAVFLEGPRGVGTSALAGELVGQLRGHLSRLNPVIIRVDVSAQNAPKGDPTHGVAVTLMQHFAPDETFRGSSTGRIMSWFLRRVTVEGRPVIVWLDQVQPQIETLEAVVGPLLEPGSLVQVHGVLPPVFLVFSGSGRVDLGADALVREVRHLPVPQLPRDTILAVVAAKARETGRVFTPEAMARVEDLVLTSGLGLSVLEEILQSAVAKLGCHGLVTEADVTSPAKKARCRHGGKQIEIHILEVLRKSCGKVTMGQLTEGLHQAFVKDGGPAPTGSSIRRWAVRLERAGLVERRVELGGMGGTRSVVVLASPPSVPSE